MFDQIINSSKGKQIVMFLDYDGTLSPIVDDPDRAFMSEQVSILLYHDSLCSPFCFTLFLYVTESFSNLCLVFKWTKLLDESCS